MGGQGQLNAAPVQNVAVQGNVNQQFWEGKKPVDSLGQQRADAHPPINKMNQALPKGDGVGTGNAGDNEAGAVDENQGRQEMFAQQQMQHVNKNNAPMHEQQLQDAPMQINQPGDAEHPGYHKVNDLNNNLDAPVAPDADTGDEEEE